MFPYTARASQDICSSWISHYPTEKTWSHVPWNHGGMVATYGFIWSIDVRGILLAAVQTPAAHVSIHILILALAAF